MLKKLALSAMSATVCAYAVFGTCSFSLPTVLAQSSSCSNYWVNPSTGKEECLDGRGLPPQTQAISQEQKEANGSVKVFEGENGDRAYIRLSSIRKFTRYGQNRVHFSLTTFYGKMKVGGSVKGNAIYTADCNSYSMMLHSITKYGISNEILDSMSYGNGSSSQTQSTAPEPVLAVQPGTLGFAAWDYVCGTK